MDPLSITSKAPEEASSLCNSNSTSNTQTSLGGDFCHDDLCEHGLCVEHGNRETCEALFADLDYVLPKPLKGPRKIWNPFLEMFTLFSEFPTEVRQAIWKQTLTPRVVEIKFNNQHGFYSSAKPPVALSVCQDSRHTIKHLYPLCFGSVLFDPSIVFNFSLDTIYIDAFVVTELPAFVFSLTQYEADSLQSLAIDHRLEDIQEILEFDINFADIETLQKATRRMPSLKEVCLVVKVDEYWHEHGMPEGSGQIELMDSWTYEMQLYNHNRGFHWNDEDGESKCQELPNMDDVLEGYQASSKSVLWGRRVTDLRLDVLPWDSPGTNTRIIRG